MKRAAQNRHQVYREYPLFVWKRCYRCRQEFRRERGWRFLTGPYFNGRGHWRHLCGSCAPTRTRAEHLAFVAHMPTPEPPPPRMKP